MTIRCLLLVIAATSVGSLLAAPVKLSAAEARSSSPTAKTLRVPAEHATIQAAIDAAADGDTVLVAPGTYHEGLQLSGKSVRLVSEFDTRGDEQLIRTTILDGTTQQADGSETARDEVILVKDDAGPGTEIVGFTIRNGDDGIRNYARIRIAHNYFTANDDAVDNEGGGGVCEHNLFEKNGDDAVDYDLDSAGVVAHNIMRDNGDDGIEIRFHDYDGPPLEVVFRNNIITGNLEDGIQIIDYPGVSNRRVRIERNVIALNAMAGIGLMSDANSAEDYRAADVPEAIEVINNTIVENDYGITGGDNLVAINNIIARNKQLGMKKVDAGSVAAHNLFWQNGTAFDEASNVRDEHTLQANPQLAADYRLAEGSPCVDAGIAELADAKIRVEIDADARLYGKPDLGAFELQTE
ncbi:MAG: right-handed parallel beta-helix repeat-containing protein [Pirellulales bacterium]